MIDSDRDNRRTDIVTDIVLDVIIGIIKKEYTRLKAEYKKELDDVGESTKAFGLKERIYQTKYLLNEVKKIKQ